MELSDGLDFEAWNATVRSLASAVDRLDQTAKLFTTPTWAGPLIASLEELNLHLRRLEEANLGLPLQTSSEKPTAEAYSDRDAAGSVAAEPPLTATGGAEQLLIGQNLRTTPPDKNHPAIPVRFGDPDAIARYGRRRPK